MCAQHRRAAPSTPPSTPIPSLPPSCPTIDLLPCCPVPPACRPLPAAPSTTPSTSRGCRTTPSSSRRWRTRRACASASPSALSAPRCRRPRPRCAGAWCGWVGVRLGFGACMLLGQWSVGWCQPSAAAGLLHCKIPLLSSLPALPLLPRPPLPRPAGAQEAAVLCDCGGGAHGGGGGGRAARPHHRRPGEAVPRGGACAVPLVLHVLPHRITARPTPCMYYMCWLYCMCHCMRCLPAWGSIGGAVLACIHGGRQGGAAPAQAQGVARLLRSQPPPCCACCAGC